MKAHIKKNRACRYLRVSGTKKGKKENIEQFHMNKNEPKYRIWWWYKQQTCLQDRSIQAQGFFEGLFPLLVL